MFVNDGKVAVLQQNAEIRCALFLRKTLAMMTMASRASTEATHLVSSTEHCDVQSQLFAGTPPPKRGAVHFSSRFRTVGHEF